MIQQLFSVYKKQDYKAKKKKAVEHLNSSPLQDTLAVKKAAANCRQVTSQDLHINIIRVIQLNSFSA